MFLDKCLVLLLFLLELFLLLPNDLEVLELPHELVHGVLLDADQLLETVDLRILLQYSSLRSVQLLSMLVLHFLLEVFDISLEVIVLRLTVLLSNVKLLL